MAYVKNRHIGESGTLISDIIEITKIRKMGFLGGDYMIPVCRDEISPRPAGTDLTLRLHVEIKFCPGKAGQFFIWHLFRFVCNFFEFFLVNTSVYEIENP